ncbi:pescadillo homolog [Penaeus japonicus]|uniref:pescadillo homolog n=1 Tax=Penaeus japonicus TaxID=27405 RepID=UPI001C711883|nr:pescadillo homolog [Penaeus japonicus]
MDKRRSARHFDLDVNMDHIVLERYPTFIDAVRDLDDPLTTCFLFAKLCKSLRKKQTLVIMSNKLTIEFMHYVIAARCLKKVFISIKGYYYQADIMGQTVTWIVPHPLALLKPRGVNLKIMRTFVEFYLVLLGFVNYRLYQSLNLHYPPKIVQQAGDGKSSAEIGDLLSTLNRPLVRTKEIEEEEVQIDEHLMVDDDD